MLGVLRPARLSLVLAQLGNIDSVPTEDAAYPIVFKKSRRSINLSFGQDFHCRVIRIAVLFSQSLQLSLELFDDVGISRV